MLTALTCCFEALARLHSPCSVCLLVAIMRYMIMVQCWM